MAAPETVEHGIYVSLAELVKLRYHASGFSYLPRQPVRSVLSGRKRSRLRGRGLDFDELRHYRPGDDIRTMDWRVTSRTGKPHVRVYTEERDRPVLLIVDQRLSMFFGSEVCMKSVVAAQMAALTAWRVIGVGDRVGAILFNDDETREARPVRNQKRLLGWLGDLCAMNSALSVNAGQRSNAGALAAALRVAERNIGHDYLVLLISDFYGWDEAALKSLKTIARHNDVICSLVFDPLERNISRADSLVVSDGEYQLELRPDSHALGEKFEASFTNSVQSVQRELAVHGIPVIPVDTVTPVTDQLRRKLGGQQVLR